MISDQIILRQMQEAFFPAEGSFRDVVYFNVRVTVGSVEPESSDGSFFKLRDGQHNFSYCQKFMQLLLWVSIYIRTYFTS